MNGEAESRTELFRAVNEEIRQLLADHDPDWPALFVCECSDPNCAESLELSTRAYDGGRRTAAHLFLAPGHNGSPPL